MFNISFCYFVYRLSLLMGYGIRNAIKRLILDGHKLFDEDQAKFVQMIQFIHAEIFGNNISFTYAETLIKKYSHQKLLKVKSSVNDKKSLT